MAEFIYPLQPARHEGEIVGAATQRHRRRVGTPRRSARCRIMIRKLKSGYRICSRHKDPKTGKRRNLGTFETRAAAQRHEREIQYFKRH